MRVPHPFATRSALCLASLGLLVAACASEQQKPDGTPADMTQNATGGAERLGNDDFDPATATRQDLDLNRDNKPDAYQFTRVVDGKSVVVRKEADVNFDSKIDLIRMLDDKGELLSERLDTDFDGRIDLVVIFEQGQIVRKEYDTNFDAKVDLWRFFDKGAVLKKEADLNYDGKVDYWEYFEGGKLDRIGIDRDADGNVDEWQRAEG